MHTDLPKYLLTALRCWNSKLFLGMSWKPFLEITAKMDLIFQNSSLLLFLSLSSFSPHVAGCHQLGLRVGSSTIEGGAPCVCSKGCFGLCLPREQNRGSCQKNQREVWKLAVSSNCGVKHSHEVQTSRMLLGIAWMSCILFQWKQQIYTSSVGDGSQGGTHEPQRAGHQFSCCGWLKETEMYIAVASDARIQAALQTQSTLP